MKCKVCQTDMVRIEKGNFTIYQCANCGSFNKDFECNNHNMEFVKIVYSDGTSHIKTQCLECGYVDNKLISINLVKDPQNIPPLNEKLADNEERNTVIKELNALKHKIAHKKNLYPFLEEHAKYLKSDEWKKKRLLVLKRDNYLCQSCLESKATEVHHLSYKYWRKEPLFELVSVCKPCHDILTKISREALENINI